MVEIRTPQNEKEWETYYDLRFRVLRKPLSQPLGSEKNDRDKTGIHFALFENEKILAIARLDLMENKIAQVRFVAVDFDLQGRGFGKRIMLATESKSRELGMEKIILHARDYAVDFYLNLGYKKIEPSYKLFDVLQHFLMEKKLEIT
jgi:N-acetylglutamate synthase-like GNAT family acetyltransferase